MWQQGICNCFDNLGLCVLGWCCTCVVFGQNSEKLGIGSCIAMASLFALFQVGPVGAGGLANALCSTQMAAKISGVVDLIGACGLIALTYHQRDQLKQKHAIDEPPLTSFLIAWCCIPCAL